MSEAVCGKDCAGSFGMDEQDSSVSGASPATETDPVPAPTSPEFSVATQDSYTHTLFLGPDGLRPGWGFAFYVAAFYLLQKLVVAVASSQDFGIEWPVESWLWRSSVVLSPRSSPQ